LLSSLESDPPSVLRFAFGGTPTAQIRTVQFCTPLAPMAGFSGYDLTTQASEVMAALVLPSDANKAF